MGWYDDEVDEPQTGLERLYGCLFRVVAVIVILSMLGTALSSVFYLRLRARTQPTATPDESIVAAAAATAIPATETPIPPTETAVSPTATPLPTNTPTPDPNRVDRIVFVTDELQLQTISPDGSDAQSLTDANTRFNFPVWSPDAQQIAAIGNGITRSGVFVLPADSTTDTLQPVYQQRSGGPIYLYWSPDSQNVSFITASPAAGMSFHVVPADGSAESEPLFNGQPFYWDWTADSRQILFSSNGQVGLLDVAVGEQEDVAVPGRFQAPDISTNGRFWAYAAADTFGRLSELTVEDRETGDVIRDEHAGVIALGWRPGANELAYINPDESSRRFYGPLRLLDAETGNTELLSAETVLAFFWSPNGRYLAYITFRGFQEELQEVAAKRRLTKPAQQTDELQLTLSVLDLDTGQGLQLLQFQPTALFLTQFLPFFDQYAHSHRLWAPDSDALVLPVRENGVDEIKVIPVSGGLARTIAQGSIAFWSPQ
ncbi:MAG: hypothetical protein AAF614_32220 [Chloroflexota bacterium]